VIDAIRRSAKRGGWVAVAGEGGGSVRAPGSAFPTTA